MAQIHLELSFKRRCLIWSENLLQQDAGDTFSTPAHTINLERECLDPLQFAYQTHTEANDAII